jgi:hypothetical protein
MEGGGRVDFWSRLILAPLPDDYPNRLRMPPDAKPLKSAVVILAVLFILCLVPRVWVATKLPSICPDGAFYIRLAQAVEQRNFSEVREHGVNTFPLILAALHRVGFGWEMAGQFWGVMISSLVVLPLYGWVRRQFCDRVALVAGVLYALHPALIRWSPEIIRDSTFWFLLALSLYLLWRSLVEVRPGMYLLAVATMVVAMMTRSEGLFLAGPLVVWTSVRIRVLGKSEVRIRWAVLTAIVVLVSILVGAALAAAYSGKAPIYTMGTLKLAQAWIAKHFHVSWLTLPPADSVQVMMPGESVSRILTILVPTIYRGYTAVFGLLTLLGIGIWRRVYLQSAHQAVLLSAVALLTGMWIAIWCVHESSPRYVLSAMVLGSAWPALGLLSVSQWCARWTRWLFKTEWIARAASYTPLAASVVAGIAAVLMVNPAKLGCEMRIGLWIRQQDHRPSLIVGPLGATAVVSYYSGVRDARMFPWNSDDEHVLTMVRNSRPDMVVLRVSKRFTVERCQRLMGSMKSLGLREIPAERQPEGCREVFLAVSPALECLQGRHAEPVPGLSLRR